MKWIQTGLLGCVLVAISSGALASGRTLSVVVDGQLAFGDPCPVDVEAVSFADLFIALECAASGDVIEFGPGEFSLVDPANPAANPTEIDKALTLRGQGESLTVLDRASGAVGPLRVRADASPVRIEQLTIQGAGGGARWLEVHGGSLSLSRVSLQDGNFGAEGPIAVEQAGELELSQVQFLRLFNPDYLLYLAGGSSLQARDVVMAENLEVDAMIFAQGGSAAELVNLTVTRNEVNQVIESFDSSVALAFATVAHNQAFGGFISPSVLRVIGSASSLTLTHVLIDAPDFRDCAGSNIISQGHNISAPGPVDNTCSAFDQPTDSIDQASGVRAPADTGGGVLIVPLTADSIARNGASECVDTLGNAVPRDVRGFTRPAGQPCSIGSWQYFPTAAISQVVFDPDDPQRRYAATLGQGVFVSTNGGTSWASVSADLDGLAIADLALSPHGQVLLAASTRDGVFRSTDGGVSWASSSAGLAGEALTVNRLQFDPADAQVVLAATHGGLYRSNDGGTSWTRIDGGLPNPEDD